MKPVRRAVELTGGAIMAFVAAAILVSMLAGTADVIGIKVLGKPLGGAVEGASNLMPVIVFVALAYVQHHRDHIRVEFIYARVSPRGRALMDIVTAVVVAGFFLVLLRQSWDAFATSYRIGESAAANVRFPIWLPKGLIVLGIAVMIAQLLVDLVEFVHDFRHPEDVEPVTDDFDIE